MILKPGREVGKERNKKGKNKKTERILIKKN
jgi:hypothetical protein